MQIRFSNPILARALRNVRFPSPRLILIGLGGLWLLCLLMSLPRGSAALFASPFARVVRQMTWLTPMLTFWLAGLMATRETRSDRLKEVYQSPLTDERIVQGYGLAAVVRVRVVAGLAVGLLPVLAYGPLSLGYVLAACLLALNLLAALAGTTLGLRWGERFPVLAPVGLAGAPAVLLLRGINVISANPLDTCLLFMDSPLFQSNLLRLRWLAPAPLPELGLLVLLVGLSFVLTRIPVRQPARLRPRLEMAGILLTLLIFVGADVWLNTRIERAALVEIYHANGGERWFTNPDLNVTDSLWLSDASVCDWWGIECRCGVVHGFIEYDMSGDLSPAIGRLSHLRSIQIYNSGRLVSLPPEIGRLTHLQSFRASDTGIVALPAEVRHWSELRDLMLGGELENLPAQVEQLTQLQALDISYNNLSQIPEVVYDLPKLRYLTLNHNSLREIPARIGELDNLWFLQVAGNQLTSLPPEIAQMPTLSFLDVSDNPLVSVPPEVCMQQSDAFENMPPICRK